LNIIFIELVTQSVKTL